MIKLGGTPRQTFRLDEVLWKKFQAKCKKEGYSASDVLRAFIMEVVAGKASIRALKPSKSTPGENLQDFYGEFESWLRKHSS